MAITPCRPKWKGTMTDRERFNRQMNFESVDRCFNREYGFWNDNFKQWDLFLDNGITGNDQVDEFFNFDTVKTIWGPVGIWPPFEKKVIEETETHQIIIDGAGLVMEVPKDGHETIPRYIRSTIQTPDDWARCKEERMTLDHPHRTVDVEAMIKDFPADRDYPLAVHCGSMIGAVRSLLTMEGLAYAMYDYPDMVEDMVETMCVQVEHFLDQVLGKVDFDFAAGFEDIAFKNGPLVGLDFFKSVIVPRYKRIDAKLKAAGIDVHYVDCDGDVRLLIPLFLEGGINVMFPYEVNAAGHPGEMLKEYEGELRIMGGVDKMALGAGPEAIKAYLETLVPLVERGGFIPHCDHRCPPNVKPQDYLYYQNLKEEMFGMK